MSGDPSNDYSVVAFNCTAELVCGRGCRGNDLKSALEYVSRIKPQADTAFYGSCKLAMRHLESSQFKRRVMIVFSDGQDNSSTTTFTELRDALKESSVTSYAIGLFAGSDIGSSLGLEGKSILDEFASVSGGKAFYPSNKKELQSAMDLVSEELGNQYVISFVPNARHDHKWHSIKVKVAPPKEKPQTKFPRVLLRYRESYFDR